MTANRNVLLSLLNYPQSEIINNFSVIISYSYVSPIPSYHYMTYKLRYQPYLMIREKEK